MYDIINKTNEEIGKEKIVNYIDYLIKKLKLDNCLFNVIIVNSEYIRNMNREYRNIDKETDVISFALEDSDDNKDSDFRILGDIYICIEVAKKQAIEYEHSLIEEIMFLITHGVLHLLGYDHMNESDELEMFSKQDDLIEKYKK